MSDTDRSFAFTHRNRPFELRVTPAGTLELYLDGILRKDRPVGDVEPQYVWTNVELEWEEHHYIEARYWRSTGALQVTVNRTAMHEVTI
jgi:hypothetical protein